MSFKWRAAGRYEESAGERAMYTAKSREPGRLKAPERDEKGERLMLLALFF
jgi:hypothetical protein